MAPNQRTQDASPTQDNNNDHVRIVVAAKPHRQGLLNLMRYAFLPREPIEATLGTTWEEAAESFEQEIDMILDQPYSFVAVHPLDGVVGCRTTRYIRIDPHRPYDPTDFVITCGNTPTLKIFQTVTSKLMDGWEAEMGERGIRTAFQFISLCVDERYSNLGLAKKMVEETMRLADRLKVDCAFAIATNQVSQRVLQKAGFVTWRSLDYEELLDEEGKPYVLPKDGSKSIKWVVKVLRQSKAG